MPMQKPCVCDGQGHLQISEGCTQRGWEGFVQAATLKLIV